MNHFQFLREYSSEELAENRLLTESSISNLPFTMSYPVEQMYRQIDHENFGRGMNYALDFFEITVQYVSCVLLAILQEKEKQLPAGESELLRIVNFIDNKRPLSFGDWVNDIFNPLIQISSRALPENELVKNIREHLIVKKQNKLLGYKKEPSVVRIRNEYKGHSTTLSENIYKNVVYTLEPLLMAMLRAVAPMQQWEVFSCCSGEGDEKKLISHNGSGRKEGIKGDQTFKAHHYYIKAGTTASPVDLFPLVFRNERGYVYVFQSLKEESVSWISSDENAVTFIDDCWNDHFDKKLQKTNPAFDISKSLNWDEWRTLMYRESQNFLGRAYKDKKYNQELFVDRKHLSSLLQEFLDSDKVIFPLLGEAGQGKTNQLCFWTEQMLINDKGILLLGGSDFSSVTLQEKIKSAFGIRGRKAISKQIDVLHEEAEKKGQDVYIFFDAINECLTYKGIGEKEGPVALFDAICDLFLKKEYTRFKILFTCRTYTWKTLFQNYVSGLSHHIFGADNEDEAAVRGFTDSELKEAYKIYGHLYQMKTDYPALPRSSTIRLKDPLVLKIACTNYLGLEMPGSMLSYTSITLFDEMMTKISNSYAGKYQCAIIKGLATYMLEKYENNEPSDRISAPMLRAAYDDPQSDLHKLAKLIYKKDGITIAYAELLNKPERPVLRLTENPNEKGEDQIQFIYERFLEYIMALVFTERETALLEDKNLGIPASKFAGMLRGGNANVVFMRSICNAILMDFQRTQSLSAIIDLVRVYGNDPETGLLINEVFNVLIRENYEKVLFELITKLLDEKPEKGESIISEFNQINKKIETNQADSKIIARHKQISEVLLPVVRMRKLALVSTLNGVFLTDYFNENLYKKNPFNLLWRLMTDPITEIVNDSCMYAYYLSNKKYTLEYSPLKENLSERIVKEMYGTIKSNSLVKTALLKNVRQRSMLFLETATRLIVLLIIDTLMAEKEESEKKASELMTELKNLMKYITANFVLIRAILPLLKILLRKQITFQADYVNNAIEYQTHWDGNVIPSNPVAKQWSKPDMGEIIEYVYHYYRCKNDQAEPVSESFTGMHDKILDAYQISDSFSFFILERTLIIMGVSHWGNIAPIVKRFFNGDSRQTEFFGYAQMSMLYVLYQVQVNAAEYNEELMSIYERESADWTIRHRGLFKGRNSHKANTTGLYKRNVMNWYCVVYCSHSGDAVPHEKDEKCVPVFYKMIDQAIADHDKELLFHLIENISELISDFGYIRTALDLLKYIMLKLDSVELTNNIDQVEVPREGVYKQSVTQLIGNVLSTAKNYFPAEVNTFLRREIIGLPFPGIEQYREEILNYNPSGETLSDLFTHKFGNFLMWALLNMKVVDDFAYESVKASLQSKSSIDWYDNTVRIMFRHMFGLKL